MALSDQIADFNQFAHQFVAQYGDEAVSLDTVIEHWQSLRSDDIVAIRAALKSYDAGERGISAEEAMAKLRARLDEKRS